MREALGALDLVPQITVVLEVVAAAAEEFPCRVVFVNQAFKDKVSANSDPHGNAFWSDHFDTEAAVIRKAILHALASGTETKVQCKLLCVPDNKFPINEDFQWRIVAHKERQLVVLSGERHLPELKEDEKNELEELRDFFDNGPIAMHWLTAEGNVLWANKTEMETLGYTKEEYIGKPIMNFCPDEKELVLEIFQQLGSGNTIRDVPVRFRTKRGDLVHLLVDSNVKYHRDGSFHHTRCFIRDDTNRVRLDSVARYVEQILGFLGHNMRNPLTTLISFQDDLLHKRFDVEHGPTLAKAIHALRHVNDEVLMFQEKDIIEKVTSMLSGTHDSQGEQISRSNLLQNLQSKKRKKGGSVVSSDSDKSEDMSFVSSATDQATMEWYFDNNLHTVFTFANSKGKRTKSTAELSQNVKSVPIKTVLHVDDEKMIHMVSKRIITKYFPNVEELDFALDGKEALSKIEKRGLEHYDIILMDIVMPNMNGFEASVQLRELGYNGPIIAVSANVSDEQIEKAKSSGMSDFVAKPFTKNNLDVIFSKYGFGMSTENPPEALQQKRNKTGE